MTRAGIRRKIVALANWGTEPLDIQLTVRRLLFLWVIPIALVFVMVTAAVWKLDAANDQQNRDDEQRDRADRIEKRQETIEKNQTEQLRQSRAIAIAASDRLGCRRVNDANDILGDIIRGFIAQADTPEQAERTRAFFGDALKRLEPIDCDALPSSGIP